MREKKKQKPNKFLVIEMLVLPRDNSFKQHEAIKIENRGWTNQEKGREE